MRVLRFLACIAVTSLTVLDVCEANRCLCAHSGFYRLYQCQTDTVLPSAFLEQDGEGNNCLLAAPEVITSNGWMAGIYVDTFGSKPVQKLVYFKNDSLITDELCKMTKLQTPIDYNQACTRLKPGMSLNNPATKPPTKATVKLPVLTKAPTSATVKLPVLTKAPTSATVKLPVLTKAPTKATVKLPVLTKAPTNATPTASPTPLLPNLTKGPTSAPTQVTQSAQQTTSGPVFVTVAPQTSSTKCDWQKMVTLASNKIAATHPSSRFCGLGSGLKGDSEALLFSSCTRPRVPYYPYWQSELKVVDHCNNIPKGEPLAVYAGQGSLATGVFAAFWKCTGTSFQVIYQSCGTGYPRIGDVRTILNTFPEMVYTIRW
ncbi:hypothetical protein ACF0H5_019141 [Mactra antiquata]